MRWIACVIIVLLCGPIPRAAAPPDPAARPCISLRLYPQMPMRRELLRTIGETLESTLRSALDISWYVCGRQSDAGWPQLCDRPLGRGTLGLRLIEHRRRQPSGALGSATIAGGSSVLANILVGRVGEAALAANVDPAVLIGRVAAHEVGHLLLGAGAPRSEGLMRPLWSPSDLGLLKAWTIPADQRALLAGACSVTMLAESSP